MAINVQITGIHNNPAGKDTAEKLNDEYVVVKNLGDQSVNMYGWQLTDWRPGQQHLHIYKFPQRLTDGSLWTLDPGEVIYLMTGTGCDRFYPADGTHPAQFHLFWNKDWFIWNNTGDTACLYDSEGKLVNQFKVP